MYGEAVHEHWVSSICSLKWEIINVAFFFFLVTITVSYFIVTFLSSRGGAVIIFGFSYDGTHGVK